MSKKLKFILVIVTILILIGLIFGISTIVRFVKLNSIYSKVETNIMKDNFLIESKIDFNGNITNTYTYYKDGIGKFVSSDNTYTWTDGEKAYNIDEENKTAYIMDMNSEENKKILISYNLIGSLVPGYSKSLLDKIYLSGNLANTIKTEKVNDEKCIKISIKEDNFIKTTWISKKSMSPVKSTITFSNSNEVIETTYNIKYQQTSLKQIELPSLKDYKIIDSNGNEVVEDNKEETNSIAQNQAV